MTPTTSLPQSTPATNTCQQFCQRANRRCELTARVLQCGSDLLVGVCGGSLHHIGAVALAQPEADPARQATVSTLCAFGHRDDEVARRMAKQIAGALSCTVVVSAGIHIDDATPSELAEIVVACNELAIRIIDAYCPKA